MKNDVFKELSNKEQMEIDGGIVGVDDAALVAAFLAAAAIGASIGISKKNRE